MITVYELVRTALDSAESRGLEYEAVYYRSMIEHLTLEEAEDPAAYFGVKA